VISLDDDVVVIMLVVIDIGVCGLFDELIIEPFIDAFVKSVFDMVNSKLPFELFKPVELLKLV
jgi:hypothetical protein